MTNTAPRRDWFKIEARAAEDDESNSADVYVYDEIGDRVRDMFTVVQDEECATGLEPIDQRALASSHADRGDEGIGDLGGGGRRLQPDEPDPADGERR